MKKLYYPGYHDFKCIGPDCPMSCCYFQIRIFRFEEKLFDTCRQWADIDGKGGNIRSYLEKDDDGYYMKCKPDGCCVFRNGDKLCDIQLRHGDSAIPAICRTYPRIISRFPDRIEYALEPCCPVVAMSAREWETGTVITSREAGDGYEGHGSVSAVRRDEALSVLADTSLDLKACLERLSSMYGCGIDIPELDVSEFLSGFIRKQTALMTWAYILHYEGIPEIENVMEFIISTDLLFIRHASQLDLTDWKETSYVFSRFLLDYSYERGFILDYEDRFCDKRDYQ